MSSNTELIRSHVDTIILNVLDEKDRYGYEILSLIEERSHGRYVIKQPTLYSCLKRLEKQGFISSYYGDETNGGRRRYYKLTDKGTETLNVDQREWEYSRTILNNLLSDRPIDLKTIEPPFDANELKPLTKRVKAYDNYSDKSSFSDEKNSVNFENTALGALSPSFSNLAQGGFAQGGIEKPLPLDSVNYFALDISKEKNAAPLNINLNEGFTQKTETADILAQSENKPEGDSIKVNFFSPEGLDAFFSQKKAALNKENSLTNADIAEKQKEYLEKENQQKDNLLMEDFRVSSLNNPAEDVKTLNAQELEEKKVEEDKEVIKEKKFILDPQKAAAAKLLQIGDFAENPRPYFEKRVFGESKVADNDRTSKVTIEGENELKNKTPVNLDEVFSKSSRSTAEAKPDSFAYRNFFSSLYSSEPTVSSSKNPNSTSFDLEAQNKTAHHESVSDGDVVVSGGLLTSPKIRQFNDLKNNLLDEGYKLRTFNKTSSFSYYNMNYSYSNKLLRDTALLCYLFVIIELLAIFISRKVFEYNPLTLGIIALSFLIVPLFSIIKWAKNPTRRARAKFNFVQSFIVSVLIFVVLSGVAVVITLFAPGVTYNFQSAKAYVPFILIFNVVIFPLVYGLLYRSKNYHIKG